MFPSENSRSRVLDIITPSEPDIGREQHTYYRQKIPILKPKARAHRERSKRVQYLPMELKFFLVLFPVPGRSKMSLIAINFGNDLQHTAALQSHALQTSYGSNLSRGQYIVPARARKTDNYNTTQKAIPWTKTTCLSIHCQ